MKKLNLFLLLFNVCLGALVLAFFIGPWRPFQTEILSYEILEEGPDYLDLAVSYAFTDEWEQPTFMGGHARAEEKAGSMDGSFRPVQLQAGRHTATLHLGFRPKKPSSRCTTELTIDFYIPRSAKVYSYLVPFKKCWTTIPFSE